MKPFLVASVLALVALGCVHEPWPLHDDPREQVNKVIPERLSAAMGQSPAEVLPTVDPEPRLVAQATASTGQSVSVYEYRPVPQPEGADRYVVLRFVEGALSSVGYRQRAHPRTALEEWTLRFFRDDAYDDPYGPGRVRRCVEAIEASVYVREPGRTVESSSSC